MDVDIYGYYINGLVIKENINKAIDDNSNISITEIPFKEYSWFITPMTDFHEYNFKIYNNIPLTKQFEYK